MVITHMPDKDLINIIESLPEKRDDRFKKFVQDKFIEDKISLIEILEI
jgi:hypothetical protein